MAADDGVEDLTSLFYHVFDFIEVGSAIPDLPIFEACY